MKLLLAFSAVHCVVGQGFPLPPFLQNPALPSLLPGVFSHPAVGTLKCGGPNHQECSGNMACRLLPGACKTDPSATGLCTPPPPFCLFPGSPVCGCDGKTYSSSCEAFKSGTSVAEFARCGGAPDAPVPREPLSPEEPSPPPFFEPLALDTCNVSSPCGQDQYCNFEVCGSSFATGVCVNVPVTCPAPDIDESVCGCDGFTYQSECEAARAYVSIRSRGPCPWVPEEAEPQYLQPDEPAGVGAFCTWDVPCSDPRAVCINIEATGCIDIFHEDKRCVVVEELNRCRWDEYVCACDGTTYSSDCSAWERGLEISHYGPCETKTKEEKTPRAEGECDSSDDCEGGYFCNVPDGECGGVGTCYSLEECNDEYEPVCGCDGVSYTNWCTANRDGYTSVNHTGSCMTQSPGRECLDDTECPDSMWCQRDYTECGLQDIPGVCVELTSDCPNSTDWVCGCNGVMYESPCKAAMERVSLTGYSACSNSPLE